MLEKAFTASTAIAAEANAKGIVPAIAPPNAAIPIDFPRKAPVTPPITPAEVSFLFLLSDVKNL